MTEPSPLPSLQPNRPKVQHEDGLTPQPMIRIPWVSWVPVPQPSFTSAVLALYLGLSGGMLIGCVAFTFGYLFGWIGPRCELCP